ncbi:MAG: hypothetical protein FWF79_09690 [Defluviitaleaceae bacterium]|nr:hypothetical protein [Defluviitaleaceae bacterium]
MKKFWIVSLILVVVLALATACGGGDDEPAATPTPTPPATEDVVTPGGDADETPTEVEVDTPTEVDEPDEPEFVPIVMPAGVVYDMSLDSHIQGLDAGTVGGVMIFSGTQFIMTAGSPTYSIVEGPYGNAIRLTNREYDWNGIDFVTEDLGWNIAANSYLMTVTGHVGGGGVGRIGGADGPWTEFVTAPSDDDGNFVVSLVLDADLYAEAGSRNQFRIQTNCTFDLTIYNITVMPYGEGAAAADDNGADEDEDDAPEEVAPPVEVDEPVAAAGGVVWSLATDGAFQGQDIGDTGSGEAIFNPTPHLVNAGGFTATVVAGVGGIGFEVSNRTEYWHAADVLWADLVPDYGIDFSANSYTITFTGTAAAGSYMVIEGRTAPWDNQLATLTTDGNFTISATLSDAAFAAGSEGNAGSFSTGVRIRPNNNMDPYSITSIVITRN